MNPLIDEMYEHFRHHVYVGEVVYATLRTGSRAVLAKIIEKIPTNTPNGTIIESADVSATPLKSTSSSSASTPSTSSRAVKNEDTSDKDHPFMYKVHLLNRNLELLSENESDADDDQESGRPSAHRAVNRQLMHVLPFRNISRDRTILSKTLFKKFIKEYATREPFNFAPWSVRPDIVKLYGVTKTLTAAQLAEIERKKTGGKPPKEEGEEGQKTRRSRKKEPGKVSFFMSQHLRGTLAF
jgi:hypothetical protein